WDSCFFFFFQAEDGIRDRTVTGVQTCALPILILGLGESSGWRFSASAGADSSDSGSYGFFARLLRGNGLIMTVSPLPNNLGGARSEERRVGKECRAWGWAYVEKKQNEKERVNE